MPAHGSIGRMPKRTTTYLSDAQLQAMAALGATLADVVRAGIATLGACPCCGAPRGAAMHAGYAMPGPVRHAPGLPAPAVAPAMPVPATAATALPGPCRHPSASYLPDSATCGACGADV
jgi:hypothetical protein